MADNSLHVGQVAAIAALSQMDITAGVEFSRHPGRSLELFLWLPPEIAARYIKAGEFWTDWHFGEPCWVRFALDAVVFNRAAFAAVEVRPARDPAQRPQGASWLLSSPPRQSI